MYCKSCGRTLPDGVTYCDVCEIELTGSGKRGFVDEGLVTLPNETTNWLSRQGSQTASSGFSSRSTRSSRAFRSLLPDTALR